MQARPVQHEFSVTFDHEVEDLLIRFAFQYLLMNFFEDFVNAFFRLRGLWLTSPVDVPRFIASRDAALGELAGHFLVATTLPERLNCGRDMVNLLFKDVPNPARID